MKHDKISKDKALQLYRTMCLLREFENNVSVRYRQGEIPGFVHLYQGEEAVATGVCAHLTAEDIVASTHRGHGHVLAKGCDVKGAMAELYAKTTGLSGGRGGSMHMYDKAHGLLGTNGIVGGSIPMALGAALTFKTRGVSHVAVAFFGDGGSNMGILYESLNLASKFKLPVLFVCENNLYATSTELSNVAANPEIATRAGIFNMAGIAVDGNDIKEVFLESGKAVERARGGEGPTLIEARTYRHHGHHEGDELYGTYRTKEEVDHWKENRDPLELFRKCLLDDYSVSGEDLAVLENGVNDLIQEAIEFSKESEFPCRDTVHDYIFKG